MTPVSLLDTDESICAICLDVGKKTRYFYNCSHRFHEKCMEEWMKRNMSCPICRNRDNRYIALTKRILIWNENQRSPAKIYKDTHKLIDHEIIVIRSIEERREGDIVYHFP